MVTARMPEETMVMTMPAFAMSEMLKYPAEYGITFVGEEVTRIKASGIVRMAGIIIPSTGNWKVCVITIRMGAITVAVTVLLDSPIFKNEIIRINKIIKGI